MVKDFWDETGKIVREFGIHVDLWHATVQFPVNEDVKNGSWKNGDLVRQLIGPMRGVNVVIKNVIFHEYFINDRAKLYLVPTRDVLSDEELLDRNFSEIVKFELREAFIGDGTSYNYYSNFIKNAYDFYEPLKKYWDTVLVKDVPTLGKLENLNG